MAKNRVHDLCNVFYLPVVSGVVSGDPVVVSRLTGVAETTRDSAGYADVKVEPGPVYDLSVKAIDEDGNSAVAHGDAIYLTAGDTPKLSKKASGIFIGYALEVITSGATDTINVLIAKSPGGAETGAIEARDVLISGSTKLSSWRKSTDLTKIDGAQISNGTVPAAALASGAFTADQMTISGAITLADWRKGGDLEKIDGADISVGTIPGTALATAANIALSKILVDGVTTLDTWQKGGDLTKIDGAKLSAGTVVLAALATALRTWHTVSIHIPAATIANGDLMTDMTLPTGMTGELVKVYAVVTKAITTGGKAANINFEINTTNVTGGVIALSGTYALGAVVEGTAITADNAIVSEDELSIEASGVTTFIEGEIEIVMMFKSPLV